MKIVQIKQTLENSALEEIGEVMFCDNDMQLLKKFVDNLIRLKKADFFTKEIPAITKITWGGEEGLKFSHSDFQDKDIHQLLHLLRPFMLKSDAPASFEVIKSIFGKVLNQLNESRLLRLHLKKIGDLYQKGVYQPFFNVKINEIGLFTEGNLDCWLNGIEYHQNPKKEIQVKKLEEVLGEQTSKAIFISQLLGRIEAIFRLGEWANSVINIGEIILVKDPPSGLTFPLSRP